MPGIEGLTASPPPEAQAPHLEQEPLESPLDFEHILDVYGLGPQEASTIVTFGGYTGTFGSALLAPDCPVRGILAKAYASDGLAGVEAKLEAFKVLDEGFSLVVSPQTRSYHQGTLGRSDLLAKATERKEPPDFLAL